MVKRARLETVFERQALDLAPVMIRDFAGRITLWTSGMQRLYLYRAAEALGRVAQDLLKTLFPAPVAEIEAEVRETGVWHGELHERRRDGAAIVVASQWSLLCDNKGSPAAMLVCNSDITQETKTRADRELLANIVESSHAGVIGKDLSGIVTSWNKAAEEIFGYSSEEMIGRSVLTIFPPDLVAEETMILAMLRRGERIEHYETRRLGKDHRPIDISLTVSPICDADGKVIGASKIVRDITEQKRLRARLDEVQSELLHVSRLNDMGQLASAFAHELNQPLSAIVSYLGGVRRLVEMGDIARAIEGCERASAQVARIGDVVRRLRQFVGKGEAVRLIEDLAPIVEDAANLALIGSRTSGLKVEMHLAPDARCAFIDKVQIQQVLVNLIRNAAEAMSTSMVKELRIESRRRAIGMIELDVIDSGPGLSPDIADRLFQPFATTKATGMGVGLSLCRNIIEAHGGEITAQNCASGGAIFRFTLPDAMAQPAAARLQPSGSLSN